MVGRAATNPEPGLASVPSLPAFERLAPPGPAEDFVAAIEAWTKPGDVVLDLNGRGGWVARAALAEQRRAADLESWPLTRLLADVVLRPPGMRQLEAASAAIAGSRLEGSTIKKTIDALYASTCPRCGRAVVLESMVWQPVALPARLGGALGRSIAGTEARGKAARAATSTGVAALPELAYSPGEALKAVAREYRCAQCHEQLGGSELRVADPTVEDVRLAQSVSAGGDVRETMRRRFPAPRPTHPLVDQLIDLHTPRQLLGLHAILARIDAEERVGATTAGLRLALLHAVILASRLYAAHGEPSPIRISNGVLKVPAHEWHELNPWLAFEGGLQVVKAFVQRLEQGTPAAAVARLGNDLAALEGSTSNAAVGEATPASLRRLGLHGEKMALSNSTSRVRLLLGQPSLGWTPERLAASYHGTGWIFGAAAVALLPYGALFRPYSKPTSTEEAVELARSVGRTLAIAAPAMAQTSRAVFLLDDAEPGTLVAAALGGAAAGCRLADARVRRGGADSGGIAVYIPPTGVMAPGPRTRANRPLPPVPGGAGDPGTILGRGVLAGPEKVDDGPFQASVAAQAVTDTAVELLKARGEPAPFELLLGDLLIGLDNCGQLARLARALRPARAGEGWAAWVEPDTFGPSALGESTGGPASGLTGEPPDSERADAPAAQPADAEVLDKMPRIASTRRRGAGSEDPDGREPQLDPIQLLIKIIRDELDRSSNRRISQIEPGQYWLGREEDRSAAATPLADRVEWAVYSLLSSAGHLTERASIDRTAAMFKGRDTPDGALVEACLASYAAPESTPDAVIGFEQLETRTAEHDGVIAMLADLGHRLGMRVWIGKRQQARRVHGRPLAAWLDDAEREVHLPLIAWAPEGEIDRVDCAWYVRRKLTFLFEVEWTAMLADPVQIRHARYPIDDRVVRFLVIAPERAELVKVKLARSPLLRKALEERNWHFIKWNHLAEFAAREEATLEDLEPYLGLDAAANSFGKQLPLF